MWRKAHVLLHGDEKAALGDAGYQGVERLPEVAEHFADVRWYVAAKRGKVKAMAEGKFKEAVQAFERAKAQVRSYVEHPFHVIKSLSGQRKVRCCGFAKNTAQLHTLFALANLALVQRALCSEIQA